MTAAGSLDYLPVGERPEWADVVPLLPPATPQPVVQIGRDPLLGDLMDYFWAAVAVGELRWVSACQEKRHGWAASPAKTTNLSHACVLELQRACAGPHRRDHHRPELCQLHRLGVALALRAGARLEREALALLAFEAPAVDPTLPVPFGAR
jgi:hypothetical protein